MNDGEGKGVGIDQRRQSDGATDWYRRGVDETLDALSTEPAGLSDGEAERRREEYGPNRLREQTTVSKWQVLLNQFTDPLIYVLVGALVVTLAIGKYADAIVVGLVLAINATIGFIQEYRAETAVQSLMQMVSPTAVVCRDGRRREIDAEDVVPGDIVVLAQGEVVPADARLIETNGLRIDESALTGESIPADKATDPLDEDNLAPADQRNIVFMGTAITSGEGVGVVVETGTGTQMGEISEQVEEAGTTETPLEARIDRLAKWITVAILGVAVVAFFVGLLIGRSVSDMLLLAVALAVSAIPAGLPVVVTVALAIGVNRMARRQALIRQLPAVDTLGSCSVIVSDKTGTLTRNRMTVQALACGDDRIAFTDEGRPRLRRENDDGDDPTDVDVHEHRALHDTLLVGALCNDASLGDEDESDENGGGDADDGGGESGDPMEIALLDGARRAGMDPGELARRHPERDRVPFVTERRFMATIHDVPDGEGPLVAVKGAPERIAEMCDRRLTADGEEEPVDADDLLRTSEDLAVDGLRVLAMAIGRGERAADEIRGDDPHGLVFVGMQGLLDPPRDSAVGAVDACHDAGIRVLMVTGDHAATAAAIGHQIHIDRPARFSGGRADETAGEDDGSRRPRVITGQEIAEFDDDELDRHLREVEIYSRVAPGQKMRIVDRLEETGEVVAVTGDGVNDAPALQSAHIGAAMGSGTDVAKEASDMVITDDDFASVYAAVEEGRTAFRNIRMATFFLLSTGAAEVLIILTALLLDWPLPLIPAQILWLNVVTNGIADVALAFEPGEKELYEQPPRPRDEGILDQRLLERLVIVGVWLAAGSLAVFYWQWHVIDADLVDARTATLTALVLFQMVHVFNSRSEDVSIFRKSLLANKVLLAGVAGSLAVHIAAMYWSPTQDLLDLEPMALDAWLVAIGVALTAIIVNEAHKRFRPRSEEQRVRKPNRDGHAGAPSSQSS
ncbi:MAG: cation-translocating P-type ATPase [Acidimicrobiales bacterium]